MPRQPRLDAPGLLQHVMARGIESCVIFRDDKDRRSFIDRVAFILDETQTQCFAWAVLPNHFHLLLRTGQTPLSRVMRRIMTGYAVAFNKRHKRSGHLFQNRYKSIVCEEDPYLLELIRYIHLNPLREGIIKTLKELDTYPWTGHSAIVGRRKNLLLPHTPPGPKKGSDDGINESAIHNAQSEISLAEKTIQDVLLMFDSKTEEARQKYRQFLRSGVNQGNRADVQGGGLVRSTGGDTRGLLGRRKERREKADERILGSGAFVDTVLREANEIYEMRARNRISLDELILKVITDLDLDIKVLQSSRRNTTVSHARALISYLAVDQLGFSASEVARKLRITGMAVGKCADRGKKIVDSQDIIGKYLQ